MALAAYSVYDTGLRHDYDMVIPRIAELKSAGASERSDRMRIKAIMDGGPAGIAAVMAWDQGRQITSTADIVAEYGYDMPAVNLMASGVERLAQRVGDMPTLHAADSHEREMREKFQKRRAIVADWDQYQQIESLYPQMGRWLPGYAHAFLPICQGMYRYSVDDTPYPRVELRDSYDVYPGFTSSGAEPEDVVVARTVPLRLLRRMYPDLVTDAAVARLELAHRDRAWNAPGTGPSGWDGENTGIAVDEYHDRVGKSLVVSDLGSAVAFIPNPIHPEPAFVVMRKYSYSANVSHYHHIIGLSAMMTKLNIIGLIASEDSVFKETNVFGDMESGYYDRGRFAVNRFAPNARVERITGDQANQLWAQIDRLERQLRIGAAYDVSNDGISPNSFATGQGIDRLADGTERNVAEYNKVMRWGTERLDARRLMWADRVWHKRKTKLYYFTSKDTRTYTPAKDIDYDYRTRRSTPVGGIWGSPQHAVLGLQLLQVGALDLEHLQDAIPGIADGEAILQNNRARKAEEALLGRFSSLPPGQPYTPSDVDAMLIEIMDDPDNQTDILRKYLSPPPPEEAPEGMMPEMPGLPGMPGAPGEGGAPPGVWDMMEGNGPTQTSLSRVMTNGQADAGVQLAGRL